MNQNFIVLSSDGNGVLLEPKVIDDTLLFYMQAFRGIRRVESILFLRSQIDANTALCPWPHERRFFFTPRLLFVLCSFCVLRICLRCSVATFKI